MAGEQENNTSFWTFRRVFVSLAGLQVLAAVVLMYATNQNILQYMPSWNTVYRYSLVNTKIPEHAQAKPMRIHIYNYNTGFFGLVSNLCRGCEDICYATTGPETYMNSTIVLFLAPGIKSNKPPKKYPGQVWIFFGQESPPHHITGFSQFKNLFNWTFTHRRDSDIMGYYGGFEKVPPSNSGQKMVFNNKDLPKSQTAKIAWLVSNCNTPSKRRQYANRLAANTTITLDIYGACGKHKCPKSTATSCMNLLNSKYNFYLAFENSLCLDYITEKGFKTFTKTGHLLPIVRGVGKYYSIYLPPHSYINTHDYTSIKQLQADIVSITQNETRYKEYFEWKRHYRLPLHGNFGLLCVVAKRLKQKDWQIKYKRVYEDVDVWLHGTSENPTCRRPTDLL